MIDPVEYVGGIDNKNIDVNREIDCPDLVPY